MPPIGLARGAGRVSALLLLLLIISCGGSDGGDGSRPTVSPTRSPTATLPSPERPSLTRPADQTDSPVEPTAPPSSEPGEQEATSETAPTAEDTGTTEEPGEESAAEAADDEVVPTWLWWLLAALLIGCLVAIPLSVRARRRNAWRQELARQEGELAWFARELLTEFRHAGSRELVTGGWAVGRARVTAAEDRLTVLESTAPDDAGRQRARTLRDAARRARVHMEQLTGPGSHDTWALDLDAIIADLERATRRPSGSSRE